MPMAALVLHTYVRADRETGLCRTGADKDTPTLRRSDGSNGLSTFYDFLCFDWDH